MRGISYITVLLLSSVILLQSASLLLVNSSYIANHSYIASVLCENRDKPQMHCDGKCVLKRELNNQQEKESSQKTLLSFSFVPVFFEEATSYKFFSSDVKALTTGTDFSLSPGYVTTSERPPTC
jgi:hypothetical protein